MASGKDRVQGAASKHGLRAKMSSTWLWNPLCRPQKNTLTYLVGLLRLFREL